MTGQEATPAERGGEEINTRGPLHSLLNGLDVLWAFSVAEPLLGVSEIARRVQLHKSTVSRILSTLEQVDLVERDELSGRFRLGVGVIGLAGPLLANLDVRRVAYTALEKLVGLTSETAALTLWSGQESIVVEQIASPRQVKHTTPLGIRFTKAPSASVQVFLSELPETDVRILLRQGHITAGPDGEDGLFERLVRVREQGFAVNDGETDAEELSLSSPVRDHRNGVAGAILLSAPRSRCTSFLVEDFSKRVMETARQVSAQLGAHVPERSSR